MTVSDMPLADATPKGRQPRARVSTRARVRIGATLGDHKTVAAAARIGAAVRSDARRWWLIAARPASLRAWRRAQHVDPVRVPDGSAALRRLWAVDNWTTGLLVAALSVALYLAAGGLRWLAGHPARRWMALLITAGLIAGIYLTSTT